MTVRLASITCPKRSNLSTRLSLRSCVYWGVWETSPVCDISLYAWTRVKNNSACLTTIQWLDSLLGRKVTSAKVTGKIGEDEKPEDIFRNWWIASDLIFKSSRVSFISQDCIRNETCPIIYFDSQIIHSDSLFETISTFLFFLSLLSLPLSRDMDISPITSWDERTSSDSVDISIEHKLLPLVFLSGQYSYYLKENWLEEGERKTAERKRIDNIQTG